MFYKESNHFESLRRSYSRVGTNTLHDNDFNKSSISSSRKLFTDHSLDNRKPITKDLEVYALVSGVKFENFFTDALIEIQRHIGLLIENKLRYWVLPENLGVEYCVFKWPDESWDERNNDIIKEKIKLINHEPFIFNIYGIQVNQDGCVIAKGYDENRTIFKIREYILSELGFAPERQSSWAHVPLGRILEPIGEDNYYRLKNFINDYNDKFIASCKIDSLKFVFEQQWYMEKKNILYSHKLLNKQEINLT